MAAAIGTKRKNALFQSRKSLLLAGAACVAPALFAPARADTINDAMALAYTANPTLLAARAELRATDENVPIALSGWRPTLSLSGSVQRQRTAATEPLAPGGPQSFQNTAEQTAATFTQPVFNGFGTVASTAQAEDQVSAERAKLALTEASVLLAVTTAYLNVLQNQSVAELNVNNVQLLARQLDATNTRFNVGELTQTEVAEAKASLESAIAQLVLAEGTLKQSRAVYESVVGKAPENLAQPPIPSNLPVSLDTAVAAAILNNPSYLQAEFTAKSADENIRVARSTLLPQVNATGQWLKGYNLDANGYREDQAVAGAQVTVPLYQSGAEYAQLRQTKDVAGQQHLLVDQARLDARNAVTIAWEAYQAATASIDSYKSQISAGEIAVDGLQTQMEVGSATILDVLIQEQNLLTARVNLVGSQHDQAVAAYQVLAAVGLLNGAGLGLNVSLYDPAKHYNDVRLQAFGSNKDADSDARIDKNK